MNADRIFVFDADEYELAVGGRAAQLPELQPAELGRLLTAQRIPDWRLGLYRLPDGDDDPQGRLALRLLQEVFAAQDETARIVTPPAAARELRIGLELPGVPECIWQWSLEPELQMRFDAIPRFPLWVAGDRLNNRFLDYFHRNDFSQPAIP